MSFERWFSIVASVFLGCAVMGGIVWAKDAKAERERLR